MDPLHVLMNMLCVYYMLYSHHCMCAITCGFCGLNFAENCSTFIDNVIISGPPTVRDVLQNMTSGKETHTHARARAHARTHARTQEWAVQLEGRDYTALT